jgi:hypothetical protein
MEMVKAIRSEIVKDTFVGSRRPYGVRVYLTTNYGTEIKAVDTFIGGTGYKTRPEAITAARSYVAVYAPHVSSAGE